MFSRLLLLAAVGVGSVAAYNHWSDRSWSLEPRAAAIDAERASRQAARLADRAVVKASDAASKFSGTVSETALTAKITSKMALDDYIETDTIDVHTSGSTVTVTGVVRSAGERERVLRLARETQGVTQVVDRLRIRKP